MAAGRLLDGYGRAMEYARVSITDECNYRCVFCMPRPPARRAGADGNRLEAGETLRLCRILSGLGVGAFKITGGEPFANPAASAVVADLKKIGGVRSVTVTTNASLLERHAEALALAGADCVNVGFNAINPAAYAAVTGGAGTVERVIENILLARRLGLAVKLNMVPIAGINAGEIVPVAEFALEHELPVRFIELMPVGEGGKFRGVARERVMAVLERRFGALAPDAGRAGNGPAAYHRVAGRSARIGFIAALSGNFCAACNRLRLTSGGFLKTCLHSGAGVDLLAPLRRGDGDDAIAERVRAAVAAKPRAHRIEALPATAGGGEPMYRIGG